MALDQNGERLAVSFKSKNSSSGILAVFMVRLNQLYGNHEPLLPR